VLLASLAGAQPTGSLNLPPRPADALAGSAIAHQTEKLPLATREARLIGEVLSGNVPAWNRKLVAVPFTGAMNGSNCAGMFYVLPDYVAVGSDHDYLLVPLTADAAQELADRLGCTLPTRKMVDMVWTNAQVKLEPRPIPPTPEMVTMPVFARHNDVVREQRDARTNMLPLGTLTAGHKKDVVVSSRIYTNFATATRRPVVIYGWHYLSGRPIQPLYNGHKHDYVDYSHGIRLVSTQVVVSAWSPGAEWTNTLTSTVSALLTNTATAHLLSDEGPIDVPQYQQGRVRSP